jgi:chromosome partitioning protein
LNLRWLLLCVVENGGEDSLPDSFLFPLELQRGIVLSAIRAATDGVVALAPRSAEWDVPPKVWEAIDEVAVTRIRPAPVSVLWNRVRGGTTSAKVYREQLVEQGHYCLTAALPLAEQYAQAIGAPVELPAQSLLPVDLSSVLRHDGGTFTKFHTGRHDARSIPRQRP